MPNKVFINGRLIQEKQAVISVFDRSYLYGEGAFETMRAYNARPAFCDMHYHRLKSNCDKLKIEMPVDEYAFEHVVVRTINANKLKDAFVRVTVSPVGLSVGLSRPRKLTTNFVIFAKRFKGRDTEVYYKGARLVVVESIYADDPEVSEIKSTNYLTKMLARMEVTGKNADEGLLKNREGIVLEGTASNLFVVKKGKLFTPPLTDGCLPGVTRAAVMGLAQQLKIDCHEASLKVSDLKNVDEIFLTGTTSEVLPVREVTGLVKNLTAPGPVTKRLIKAYKELIYSR